MTQTERIRRMERNFDEVQIATKKLADAIEAFAAAQAQTEELSAYYGSDLWRRDFDDDADGKLPQTLKRGVLSEDGLYNLLSEHRELAEKMLKIAEMMVHNP